MVEDRKLSQKSHQRLKVLESCNDGFKIAEEDLRIRGEGNLTGKEQSGSEYRKFANLIDHKEIFEKVISDINRNKNYLQSRLSNENEVIFTI